MVGSFSFVFKFVLGESGRNSGRRVGGGSCRLRPKPPSRVGRVRKPYLSFLSSCMLGSALTNFVTCVLAGAYAVFVEFQWFALVACFGIGEAFGVFVDAPSGL